MSPEQLQKIKREFYDHNEPDNADPEKEEIRRTALKRIDEFFLRGLRMLVVQKKIKRCLSFDCYLLAIGQGEMIGMRTAVEIAKKHSVTKAAASECVDDFRQALKIEFMPGQRDNDGRKEMAKARKGQLK